MNVSYKFLLPVLSLFCLFSSLSAQDLDKLEAEMEKFIKMKREAVAARNKWKEEKAVLAAEKKLLVSEKEQLKKKQDELKKSVQKEVLKARKLAATLSERKKLLEKYEVVFQKNLKKIDNLKPKLPNFLQKKVETILGKIGPETGVAQKISMVAAGFNEIKQTAGKWNFSQETIKSGEEKLLCDVLFAGISAGYAITGDNNRAFTGFVTKNGWQWSENSENKGAIKKAIKAFKAGDISTVKLPFPKGATK